MWARITRQGQGKQKVMETLIPKTVTITAGICTNGNDIDKGLQKQATIN
jgi:hypothetical protein